MPLSIREVFKQAGTQQVALVQDGSTFYLVLNTKLNLIDIEMMALCNKYLDQVSNYKGNAILFTVGSGSRVFSAGLNLKKLFVDARVLKTAVDSLYAFLVKMLTLNCHTIAICNGSTVAGGLFMCFAHERAIMANHPKFICSLPEIPKGITFPPGFMKLT